MSPKAGLFYSPGSLFLQFEEDHKRFCVLTIKAMDLIVSEKKILKDVPMKDS